MGVRRAEGTTRGDDLGVSKREAKEQVSKAATVQGGYRPSQDTTRRPLNCNHILLLTATIAVWPSTAASVMPPRPSAGNLHSQRT